MGMASYFLAILFQLFIYCWHGNEVLVESQNVTTAICQSNWLSLDNNSRRMLLLIIQRADKPIRFTAGKFAYLTMETFTTVRIIYGKIFINPPC